MTHSHYSILALIVFLITVCDSALAYVDPSSIQMLLQVLLAAGIGMLVFLGRVVSFFKNIGKKGAGKTTTPIDAVNEPQKSASSSR